MLRQTRQTRWSAATDVERSVEDLTEVVAYLLSRGMGSQEEHGRILRTLLELPVKLNFRRVSVTRAAGLLYTSRRALGRTCCKAGMPTPSHILGFGRILGTLRCIRLTEMTVSDAAEVTGWPDPFSFSAAVHRLTGMRPSLARKRGLVIFAESWLQRELAAGRVTLYEPQPPPCPTCRSLLWWSA